MTVINPPNIPGTTVLSLALNAYSELVTYELIKMGTPFGVASEFVRQNPDQILETIIGPRQNKITALEDFNQLITGAQSPEASSQLYEAAAKYLKEPGLTPEQAVDKAVGHYFEMLAKLMLQTGSR